MALLSSPVFSSSTLLLSKRPRSLIPYPFSSTNHLRFTSLSSPSSTASLRSNRVRAFFFNPTDEPILKEAFKVLCSPEPVAFMGGVFAGLLRLDLNDDPLKEWVSRTVEASGLTEEEIEAEGLKPEEEEVPTQIEIE
ncbi:UPF0426 protein At1g28150, chloroplastic isoform X1 [Humulus lupulus]|uniref:UPF0426 protein At1g28150, chloroplastic isoform X1 n=1 Tax=Humulus lupulus TaxID=3486 RepID=UPI002B40DB5B|nr:UPF0426 protein At1g28150, chloroplastic isoform X1 [Humulus lupulus]